MMQNIKQTRPATWLAGGAIALSANAADAALVQVAISDGVRSFWNTGSSMFGADVGLNTALHSSFRINSPTTFGGGATVINGSVFMGGGVFGSGRVRLAKESSFRDGIRFTQGSAGSVIGAITESLTGLKSVSLDLVGGGVVDGWLVAFNDSDSFGVGGVTHFIYNDADLGDRSGTGDATIDGFNNGDYATVATVAAIPEPSSIGLLALGAAGVMLRRNRKSIAA